MSQLIVTLVGDISCEIYVTDMERLCQGFVWSCHIEFMITEHVGSGEVWKLA